MIDSGSFAANQLRTFLEANRVDLSELIRNLVTTGNVIVKRLDGIQQLLVIYPYVVEGGFTVVSKSAERALRRPLRPDHHDQGRPASRATRAPTSDLPADGSNEPMNVAARCAEPATKTNARGAQNAPQRVAATYDEETGKLTWGQDEALSPAGSLAPPALGEESWKWLYLQPLTAKP